MKRTYLTLAMSAALSVCSYAQETPAGHLIERLRSLQQARAFAFGHSDDTAYGHTWKYEKGRSDVKEVCGDYPAVINWDLGLVEVAGSKEQLDGVPFDLIRREVRSQHDRGGFNTISWHLLNPVTRKDSWSLEHKTTVEECVEQGTAAADTLRAWIGRAADFIGSLRDKKGNRIPVCFRPFHEHNGSWFWWGKDFCTPEEYKSLWRITREVFDEKGIDNVVWVYSPDRVTSDTEYFERYPGDELVDVLGADVYHYTGEKGDDTYRRAVHKTLEAACEYAELRGKLMAFSETGSEGIKAPKWWTEVLLPLCKQYPISYVCVWRNAHDKPTHFYAPFPGQESAADFTDFTKDKSTVMARQMKKIK